MKFSCNVKNFLGSHILKYHLCVTHFILVGLRIFSLSRARDKTKNIFLYKLRQLGFNLLTLVCHFRYRRVLGVDL